LVDSALTRFARRPDSYQAGEKRVLTVPEESGSWFELFKEKQKLQDEIAQLKQSVPSIQVRPLVILEGSDPIVETERAIARKQKDVESIDDRIQHLEREAKEADKIAEQKVKTAPIVWLGTQRQWAEMILVQLKSQLIEAKSETAALEQAAQHFVLKNGKKIKAKNALQNFRNKELSK
jgi:uncharacterized protein (DUF3084 family)